MSVTETTTPVRSGRPRALWALAVANLVANIGIVVTGGAVRLTASGLGCPTWPRCTDRSFVPHGELGVHGVIEFGNRTLTFVLAAIAVACWVAALLALVRTWRAISGATATGRRSSSARSWPSACPPRRWSAGSRC